jgi:hypothetical protein
MTKYIIKYKNGNMVILSGEEAEKEYDNEFKGNWETNVEIKHKNEENKDSEKPNNEGNDSLINVLTIPIFNMIKTMFMPFLSANYSWTYHSGNEDEEKKEE